MANKLFLIVIAFLIYSLSAVFCKYTSQCDFLSLSYCLFLSGVVVSLGIYAILWQKVLSFMQLNKAFLCKSITIVFILGLSVWLFKEKVTMNNLIGVVCIVSGLVVLSWKK